MFGGRVVSNKVDREVIIQLKWVKQEARWISKRIEYLGDPSDTKTWNVPDVCEEQGGQCDRTQ